LIEWLGGWFRSEETMARERTKAMAAALAEVLDGATMEGAAKAHGVTRRGLYNAMVQDGVPRHKTISGLAASMNITQVRVRQVRAQGVKGEHFVADWLEALTGDH
jgi:DNA-binding phage protein